jgi:hypothetical protein
MTKLRSATLPVAFLFVIGLAALFLRVLSGLAALLALPVLTGLAALLALSGLVTLLLTLLLHVVCH